MLFTGNTTRAVLMLVVVVGLLVGTEFVQGEFNLLPRVNQQGIHVPNPVNEVRKELNHLRHKFSVERFIQRRKQEARNSIPGAQRVHKMHNAVNDIRHAINRGLH